MTYRESHFSILIRMASLLTRLNIYVYTYGGLVRFTLLETCLAKIL